MFRKVVILVALTTMFAGLAYAGGRIVNLSYNRDEVRVKVSVDNQGAWLGCSFYTSQGRIDVEAKQVVGEDTVVFAIPEGADKCEVALWRERWNSGDRDGPDPENAWGKVNGYYLWDKLGRETINFSK